MSPSRFFQPSIVNEVSFSTYCLIVYSITTIPMVAMAVLFVVVTGSSAPASTSGFDLKDAFGTTLVAPVMETFMLALFVSLIGRVTKTKWLIALFVALLFSLLHGSIRPVWSLFVFWPFMVLTMAFITWRGRSFWWGYLAACVPHVMNNLTASLFLIAGQN